MPDWSYLTLGKRALFRLPPPVAQQLVVRSLGAMTAIPGGYRVIDVLGHMAPAGAGASPIRGVDLVGPFGIEASVDPRGLGRNAFARFGAGWLAIGPIAPDRGQAPPLAARARRGAIERPMDPRPELSLDEARALQIHTPGGCKLFASLAPRPATTDLAEVGAELAELICGLPGIASFATDPRLFGRLESADEAALEALLATAVAAARGADRPLWLGAPVDVDPGHAVLARALEAGVAGVMLEGCASVRAGGDACWCASTPRLGVEPVRELRRLHGAEVGIAVNGAADTPRAALAMLSAGADWVGLGAGMVANGPGLVKRCNEALAWRAEDPIDEQAAAQPPERFAAFWATAHGLALLAGSILATWIAMTRVLLPYDEEFLGQTRESLRAFSPLVLSFLTHDRVTLAGTMVSAAVLFVALGHFAIRAGHHWAQRTLAYAGLLGFASFFTFLGYGYFDPLHAFVTTAVLPLLLLGIALPAPRLIPRPVPNLDQDRAFRLGVWGQMLFLVQAAGLVLAGTVISTVGMTTVFVPEDLAFLCTTPDQLRAFDAQLIPLIAHDRATFGGMLLACGAGIGLTTLWGFARGARWLWWTYLLTAAPAYAATIWIHFEVGYTDLWHLLPVYIGVALLLASLPLCGPYLTGDPPEVPAAAPSTAG